MDIGVVTGSSCGNELQLSLVAKISFEELIHPENESFQTKLGVKFDKLSNALDYLVDHF